MLIRSMLAALLAMVVSGARADPVAEFYAKRLVTIVAGTATGGTYDLYARTIARHIGKYIPGSPKVVVQNVPGAGGYLGAMRVLEVGPHDGTIVGALGSSALPFQPLLDPNSPNAARGRVDAWMSVVTFGTACHRRAEVCPARSRSLPARRV